MFFVLKELFTALLLAVVVSGAVGILLILLPRGVYARYNLAEPKPLLIIGVALLFILAESIFLFGAVRVRRQIDHAWSAATTTITQAQLAGHSLSEDQLAALLKQQVPGAEQFLNVGSQEINAVSTNAAAMATAYYREVRGKVSSYIWARLLWALGAMALAAGLLIWDANRAQRYAASWQMYNLDDL